jgi:hypothetical protein
MANSAVAGYFAGGLNFQGFSQSTVDKFAFPSDTRTTLGTGLSSGRSSGTGVGNSGVAGYFGGGFDTANRTIVDRFAFPSDTRTTLGTGLSSAKTGMAGFASTGVL